MKKNIANCLSTENITVVDAMKKIQDNARGGVEFYSLA